MPGRTRYLSEPADAENGLRFRVELAEPASSELRHPFIRARKPYRWIMD
jgi:hypothetical protein